MKKNNYISQFIKLESELIEKFGRKRLEETAFPVYFNKFPPAAYLSWSRIFTAQRLLLNNAKDSVLDFGAGLGVMLPYLIQHYKRVAATDHDLEITEYIVQKLKFNSIDLVKDFSKEINIHTYDAIIALDVLEHVENLSQTFEELNQATNKNGIWIISGPTENKLYKLARKIAGTSGEGHVRNIYDVFNTIPANIICEKIYRLPWGIPLFLVGRFRKK